MRRRQTAEAFRAAAPHRRLCDEVELGRGPGRRHGRLRPWGGRACGGEHGVHAALEQLLEAGALDDAAEQHEQRRLELRLGEQRHRAELAQRLLAHRAEPRGPVGRRRRHVERVGDEAEPQPGPRRLVPLCLLQEGEQLGHVVVPERRQRGVELRREAQQQQQRALAEQRPAVRHADEEQQPDEERVRRRQVGVGDERQRQLLGRLHGAAGARGPRQRRGRGRRRRSGGVVEADGGRARGRRRGGDGALGGRRRVADLGGEAGSELQQALAHDRGGGGEVALRLRQALGGGGHEALEE
eukprot:scaffold113698_cov64-Phaeocystis_antarctica.AAC.5